jgi:hypothetical protein
MSAFNKFNQFVEDLAEKVHNLGADTIKVLLTNTAPVAGNSVKADLTEISAVRNSAGACGFSRGTSGNPLANPMLHVMVVERISKRQERFRLLFRIEFSA